MPDRIARLTEQQRICLRLVYAHMTSKEIAPKLGIEPNSVDQHVKAAMRILGVSDRRAAALMLAKYESRFETLEMREVQSDYDAQFPPAPLLPRSKGLKSGPLKRSLAVAAIIVALAFTVGMVLAVVDAWRRVFGI